MYKKGDYVLVLPEFIEPWRRQAWEDESSRYRGNIQVISSVSKTEVYLSYKGRETWVLGFDCIKHVCPAIKILYGVHNDNR